MTAPLASGTWSRAGRSRQSPRVRRSRGTARYDLPERDDEERRDGEEAERADRRQDEADHGREQQQDEAGGGLRRQRRELVVRRSTRRSSLAPRVAPQDAHERRDRQQDDPVEDDRDPLGLAVPEVVGDQPGRERQERDEQQEQEVQPEEQPIGADHVARDRRVADPDPPDRQEADDIAEVGRPLAGERARRSRPRRERDARSRGRGA